MTSHAPPRHAATKSGRHPRTDLESDLKQVLDDYVTGAIIVEGGKPLTPHRIGAYIWANRLRRGQEGPRPSTGTLSLALERWVHIGFITCTSKPQAFDDYTDAGRTIGLSALKTAHRKLRRDQRAAERATDAERPSVVSAPGDAPF